VGTFKNSHLSRVLKSCIIIVLYGIRKVWFNPLALGARDRRFKSFIPYQLIPATGVNSLSRINTAPGDKYNPTAVKGVYRSLEIPGDCRPVEIRYYVGYLEVPTIIKYPVRVV
jgi:hypothetical protein